MPPSETPPNPWDDKPTGDVKPRPTSPPQNDGQNPWGVSGTTAKPNRGRRGGDTPPPPPGEWHFDFNRMANINGGAIGLGIGAALLLWLASGLYRVQSEENAVVTRFGKYMATVADPGLHYHLPWPIESVTRPNVTFERRIEIGFRGSNGRTSSIADQPDESMMLTGDANIADVDFVVQWKIANAREFLFNIRDAEGTLKRVAESAMREVIGQNNLQDIMTDKRENISVDVKKIMQDILNSYTSGIMVTQVLIQDANVPPPVRGAYAEVNKATQEAETMRNQALRYRNQLIPRAQGEAIRLIKEAEGYKQEVVSQAQGDAQRFINVYDGYSRSKDVTRQRLYIDAWEQILVNNPPTIVDGAEKNGPLSYLDLNAVTRRKAEQNGEINTATLVHGDTQ